MNPEKIFEIAVQIAVLLFAVSFHESAHGWVAMKCGDNTARDLGRITMNPLKHLDPIGSVLFPLMLAFAHLPVFGWARPVPVSLLGVPNPRRANLLISAAGPASNLLLAVGSGLVVALLRVLFPVIHAGSPVIPLYLLAALSVMINVFLGVFNLIPIPPLDGFGVIQSLLPARFIPALIWLRRYGFLILIACIYFRVLDPLFHLVGDPLQSWLFGARR